MRFADDAGFLTATVRNMELQLNDLNRESKKIGLKIHKGKTKYMTNFQTSNIIKIENDEIEKVDQYKYLGQTVKLDEHTREEVNIRIKAGWSCFGRYKDILCDQKLPMSLRRRMFNECVVATMSHGAETWTTTKQLEQKLRIAQRAMERRMLNITLKNRIRNSDIRKKTQVKDIIKKIKEAKWRWAGHVARREDNRWTKRLTEWQPRTGKRNRGRQKRRWRDDLTTCVGATWTRLAQNRKQWQNPGGGRKPVVNVTEFRKRRLRTTVQRDRKIPYTRKGENHLHCAIAFVITVSKLERREKIPL